MIFVLAFGFSNNYYVGVLCRFLYGLSDGTMNVSKTMLAELSNKRNISLGTSFIFVGSAIGRIVGPLCSSYLTDKSVIAPLVRRFPILEKVISKIVWLYKIETIFASIFTGRFDLSPRCSFLLAVFRRYNYQRGTREISSI